MRDWINTYGRVRRYQAGGAMPPPEAAPGGPEMGAPPAGPGGGPGDLEQMLMEYAETHDPQLAVMIADALLEMLMQQQGGAPGGPEGAGAMPPPEAGPEGPAMARRGTKLRRGPIFKA